MTCVLLLSCSIPALDGSAKECPCAEGYACDEARNRCVAIEDSGASDASEHDAATDAPGADTRPSDAGREDVIADDTGLDTSIADADLDVDESVEEGCPFGGVWCSNFEETSPPYTTGGGGAFDIRRPGYMSEATGVIETSAVEHFLEPDPIPSLPTTVHARMWLRSEPSSFAMKVLVFAFYVGSDDGVGLFLQRNLTTGVMSVDFEASTGGAVETATYEPFTEWVCVQLSASPTRISMRVNEGPESSSAIALSDEWGGFVMGLLQDGLAGSGLSIDEVVIGPDPIPCAL